MPTKQTKLSAEPDDTALGFSFSPEHKHTRREFYELERFSKSSYFKLLDRGLGPVEEHIPGTKIYHITERERREWRSRMRVLSLEEESRLIDARRRVQAREAGVAAAQSPRHVSKTKHRTRRHPRKQQKETTHD
jgi:hypothetical protein